MREYHKIESLLDRDRDTHKVIYNPDNPAYRTKEFKYLAENKWVWTEKIDGTNIRIDHHGNFDAGITIGGRTDNANIPAKLFAQLTDIFGGEKNSEKWKAILRDAPSITLFGEGYGAGIQKGGGNYSEIQDFILFDVLVADNVWLDQGDVEDVAHQMGVRVVPTIGAGTLKEAIEFTRVGFNSTFGNFQAEGLVLRPLVELQNKMGKRIIGKIKTKDF